MSEVSQSGDPSNVSRQENQPQNPELNALPEQESHDDVLLPIRELMAEIDYAIVGSSLISVNADDVAEVGGLLTQLKLTMKQVAADAKARGVGIPQDDELIQKIRAAREWYTSQLQPEREGAAQKANRAESSDTTPPAKEPSLDEWVNNPDYHPQILRDFEKLTDDLSEKLLDPTFDPRAEYWNGQSALEHYAKAKSNVEQFIQIEKNKGGETFPRMLALESVYIDRKASSLITDMSVRAKQFDASATPRVGEDDEEGDAISNISAEMREWIGRRETHPTTLREFEELIDILERGLTDPNFDPRNLIQDKSTASTLKKRVTAASHLKKREAEIRKFIEIEKKKGGADFARMEAFESVYLEERVPELERSLNEAMKIRSENEFRNWLIFEIGLNEDDIRVVLGVDSNFVAEDDIDATLTRASELIRKITQLFEAKEANTSIVFDNDRSKLNEAVGILDNLINILQSRKKMSELGIHTAPPEVLKNIEGAASSLMQAMEVYESSNPMQMKYQNDPLEQVFAEVDGYFNRIKEGGLSPESAREIELKILLFKYRMTKRTLEETLKTYEMGEDKYEDLDTDGEHGGVVFANRLFGRMERLISSVSKVSTDADLISRINGDYGRVKDEFSLRANIFMTEKSVDGTIWWNGNSSGASRGIPEGIGPYFQLDHTMIAKAVNLCTPIDLDPRIAVDNERALNHKMPNRAVEMHDFRNPENTMTKTVEQTATGVIMRYLDKLYAGKLKGYEDFYRTMHLTINRKRIPEIIANAINAEFGLPKKRADGSIETPEITKHQVKRVFYLHATFINHSMLLQSSANLSDSAYYANQFLEYGLKESEQGVGGYPLSRLLFLFSKLNLGAGTDWTTGEVTNKDYQMDMIGLAREADLSKPEGLLGKFASYLAAVKTKESGAKSVRTKMHEYIDARRNKAILKVGGNPARKEANESEAVQQVRMFFGMLEIFADLSLIVIDESAFGTYPVMPLPLQYMVVGDGSASYSKLRSNEQMVMRWPPKPGTDKEVGLPITAADFTTKEIRITDPAHPKYQDHFNEVEQLGEILYEEIPWERIIPDTQISAWYNGGKNINGMLNLLRSDATGIDDLVKIAKSQKDAKYGAYYLPGLGSDVVVGRLDSEKVFKMFMSVYLVGQVDYLRKRKKSLKEILSMLNDMVGILEKTAVDAIRLTAMLAYGDAEAFENYQDMLMEQFINVGKYTR